MIHFLSHVAVPVLLPFSWSWCSTYFLFTLNFGVDYAMEEANVVDHVLISVYMSLLLIFICNSELSTYQFDHKPLLVARYFLGPLTYQPWITI